MKTYAVLFLCVGNSGLSLIAEKLLNVLGKGKFKAFSAGLYTCGAVNPIALQVLNNKGYTVDDLYSKSWHRDFGAAPHTIDFVITLCGDSSLSRLPDSFCNAKLLNLGLPDPTNVQGSLLERHAAFIQGCKQLQRIIHRFIESPHDTAFLLSLIPHTE